MTRRPTVSPLTVFLAVSLWRLTAASTASATQIPDPGNIPVPPDPQVVIQVIHDGTALWVFVLIAAVAMCLGIAATLAWQSVRAHRAARTNPGLLTARHNHSSSCIGG